MTLALAKSRFRAPSLSRAEVRRPGFAYKLSTKLADPDTDRSRGDVFGYDTFQANDPIVDEVARSITFCFASTVRDRVGDVFHVTGLDTTNHQRNPVAFFDHGMTFTLPIGKCIDPTGNYTVKIVGDLAWATVFLAEDDGTDVGRMATQILSLWKQGILNAGSVGYRPLQQERIPADKEAGTPAGFDIIRAELLEPSIVGIPANGDAVRRMLHGSLGKSLVPALRQILEPYAAPRGGLRRKSMARKGFDNTANTNDDTDSDVNDTIPHGAKAAACVHAAGKMFRKMLSDEHDVNDHPDLKKCWSKAMKSTDAFLEDHAETFKKAYPDLDGLEDEPDEDQKSLQRKAVSLYLREVKYRTREYDLDPALRADIEEGLRLLEAKRNPTATETNDTSAPAATDDWNDPEFLKVLEGTQSVVAGLQTTLQQAGV